MIEPQSTSVSKSTVPVDSAAATDLKPVATLSTNSSVTHMSQDSKIWKILTLCLFLLFLVMLGLGGFFYFKQKNIRPVTETKIPTERVLTSTPVVQAESSASSLCKNKMILGQDIADLSIKANQEISSPGKISGKIKGQYCFEGTCSITVIDGFNHPVYSGSFMLTGDWMTDELVAFSADFNFDGMAQEVPNGKIVIAADNPSGLTENTWCYEIPVLLAVTAAKSEKVTHSSQVIQPLNTSFRAFKLSEILSWKLTEEKNDYVYKLTLTHQDGSTINLTQADFGVGTCLFPGDADGEGMYYRYGDYKQIKKNDQLIWRVAMQTNQKEAYTVCQTGGYEGFAFGHYLQGTSIGLISINVKSPATLTEVYQILEKIEIK